MNASTSPPLAGADTADGSTSALTARHTPELAPPSALESLIRETMQLVPGFRLDRYELLCPIGTGGMASVWVARLCGKHGFEKLVAVKTILPHVSHDLRFQRMFLNEARIASGIDHINVARILDLGEQRGLLYLVMEWINGDSLASLHRAVKGRGVQMSPGVALRAVADACAGLHAAHELRDRRRGAQLDVVHRDVSPQNILVSSDGVVKVIDFGIAKAQSRIAAETTDGALKGKLVYMAPEQALGRPLDRRADIWSMGAVLYELLAGTPPFKGETEAATFAFITSGLPPQPLPSDVPAPVAEVVFRAIGPLDRRYSTAAELQRAIEDAMVTNHLATTSADVAAYVQKHLGERLSARSTLIDQAIEALGSQESRPLTGLNTTGAPWATQQASVGIAPAARRRKIVMRAGMAALLIAAGTAAVTLRIRRETVANTGHSASVGPPGAPSAPVAASIPPPPDPAGATDRNQSAPHTAPALAAFSGAPPARERAKPAPPTAKLPQGTGSTCDPPYAIDATGIRHYKRACFR